MSEGITLDASIDSPRVVSEALREHGCVLLRNVLPRKSVLLAGEAAHTNARRLHEMLGQEVNDMPLCFSDRQCQDRDVVGFTGKSLTDFSDPLTASGLTPSWFYEGERNYRRWFWNHGAEFPNLVLGLIVRSILPDVYKRLYGEEVVCSYAHCVVRYQRTDIREKSYSFHQDASYHSRDRLDHVGLTTWIPLTDCGEDSPGLQLYPRALHEVLPLPEGIHPPYLFCDTQLVLDRYGEDLWAPHLSAGDVLIFNHFVVHRSYVTNEMTQERQSVDFRVFPESQVPKFALADGGWLFVLPGAGE